MLLVSHAVGRLVLYCGVGSAPAIVIVAKCSAGTSPEVVTGRASGRVDTICCGPRCAVGWASHLRVGGGEEGIELRTPQSATCCARVILFDRKTNARSCVLP
jgi:hypothetical protein